MQISLFAECPGVHRARGFFSLNLFSSSSTHLPTKPALDDRLSGPVYQCFTIAIVNACIRLAESKGGIQDFLRFCLTRMQPNKRHCAHHLLRLMTVCAVVAWVLIIGPLEMIPANCDKVTGLSFPKKKGYRVFVFFNY